MENHSPVDTGCRQGGKYFSWLLATENKCFDNGDNDINHFIITDFTMIVTITDGVSLTSASLVVTGTRTVVTLVMMVVHCLSLPVSASPGHKSYCTVVYMWTGGN